MKTNELTGAALDWAVAKCERGLYYGPAWTKYSTDWAQGGPIIEREGIETYKRDGTWFAYSRLEDFEGQTPLIAAMRCYVTSQLGEEVEIPKELTE